MSDIVDVAIGDGRFKTLCAAVTAAGLVDTLKGAGPFTVFAPTDDAFGKLPPGTVESLLKDIPKLKTILLYHVVSGQYMAEDVMEEDGLTSAGNQRIPVDTSNGVMIGGAKVTQTDIECDNGVIHVIDSVMMPLVQANA
jgi:uncharacterized surface protein with fasciclin (FAS1) repeats